MDLKEKLNLDSDKPIPADFNIPYFVHQEDMFHVEKGAKRWFIGWIITFIALILTNIGWLVYESQYIETEVSQEVDTGEGAATVIGIGDYYGEGETNN